MKDLGLDSLDQVEIIMAMEDEFGECLSICVCLCVSIIVTFLSALLFVW